MVVVYVCLYILKIVQGFRCQGSFSVYLRVVAYMVTFNVLYIQCVIHSMKLSYINFKFLDVCFLKVFETEMDFSIQVFSTFSYGA